MPECASAHCSEFQFSLFISWDGGPVSFPTVEHMLLSLTKTSWLELEVCCAVLLVPVSSWLQFRAFWNGAVCRNKLFRRCGYCSLPSQREVGCYWLHSLKSESWIWKAVRSQLIRFLTVLEHTMLFLPNIGRICLIGAKSVLVYSCSSVRIKNKTPQRAKSGQHRLGFDGIAFTKNASKFWGSIKK